MACDCQDARWIKWVRVIVENKAICSICGRDIPKEAIETEDVKQYLDSLDFKGVKAIGDGETP